MQLSLGNIHHFLLYNGFVSSEELVLGNFKAKQSHTWNNILFVEKSNGNLFIKQLKDVNPQSQYRIQRDATSLFLINSLTLYDNLSEYTADYKGYLTKYNALITSYFKESITVDEYYRKHLDVPIHLLSEIIAMLSILHRPINQHITSNKSLQFLPRELPWILRVDDEPKQSLNSNSTSQQHAISYILHNMEAMAIIENARFTWKKTVLIHGDIKYRNILVLGEDQIKVIDWEYADIGDPIWDVAGLFQNIICNRILLQEGLLNQGWSRYNIDLELRSTWPTIANLLVQYISKTQSNNDNLNSYIHKITAMTAARLLQTAVEYNVDTNIILPSVIKIIETANFIHRETDSICSILLKHMNQ